jgi:periplasmic divalent cation tolerance protein
MSDTPLLAFTTLGSTEDARRLVRALVDERIVACGTVVPGATSTFRWQGAVQEEAEVVVLLKTMASRWEALRTAVRRYHPYEIPELIAVPVSHGLDAYVAWLAGEVTP